MKSIYAKTALYAYPHLTKIAKQYDEWILCKAVKSYKVTKGCFEQCCEIAELQIQKYAIINLTKSLDQIFAGFTDKEIELLDLAYWRRKDGLYNSNVLNKKLKTRKFYRDLNAMHDTVAFKLHAAGIDDQIFEEEILRIPQMKKIYKDMLKRTKQLDERLEELESKKEKVEA